MLAAPNHFTHENLTEAFKRLDPKKPLALALSGGGDSMGLLHLLLSWCGPDQIFALTVDHKLREGSTLEAVQVKTWCHSFNVKHETLTWNHAPLQSGLQAKARAARYDLMSKWCSENDIHCLLTAHTIEDQAETFAMRKSRTNSPKSLAAIWPETTWNGVKLIRPLLEISSKDLRSHLQTIGQTWLEDPSNQNEKFERVRLRRQPPNLKHADEAKAAQKKVISTKSQASTWLKENFAITQFGMGQLYHKNMASLADDVADEVLCQIIISLGGTLPEREKRQNLNLWFKTAASLRTTCGHLIFSRRINETLIGREPARINKVAHNLSLVPQLWDKRFFISGPEGYQINAKADLPNLARNKAIPAFIDQALPIIHRNGVFLSDCFTIEQPNVKIRFITK